MQKTMFRKINFFFQECPATYPWTGDTGIVNSLADKADPQRSKDGFLSQNYLSLIASKLRSYYLICTNFPCFAQPMQIFDQRALPYLTLVSTTCRDLGISIQNFNQLSSKFNIILILLSSDDIRKRIDTYNHNPQKSFEIKLLQCLNLCGFV